MVKTISPQSFWKPVLVFGIVFDTVLLIPFVVRLIEVRVILYRSVWIIVLATYLLVLVGCVAGVYFSHHKIQEIIQWLEFKQSVSNWRVLSGILFFVFTAGVWYLKSQLQVGVQVRNPEQDPVLVAILFYFVAAGLILLATGAKKVT